MSETDLQQKIMYLSGVGPKRADLLAKELGVFTYADLLYYFPYKYIDRTRIYSISEIDSEMPFIQLKGKVLRITEVGEKRKLRLVAYFTDGTGIMELVWFSGISWIKENLKINQEYIIFGKPNLFAGKISLSHPEFDSPSQFEELYSSSLQPQYITTERMKNGFLSSKAIQKLVRSLFTVVNPQIPETLPLYLIREMNFVNINQAIRNLHFPENQETLRNSLIRMKFEELFFIQLNILRIRNNRIRQLQGLVFSVIGNYFNSFYSDYLPFTLTKAQKKVIREIRLDVGSGRQMNRLLQGDVGSGKTLVALMSMLMAIDNGFQAALMAPTEILANQHYLNISRMIEGLDLKCALLTGSTRSKQRKLLAAQLESGELNILIGTHALLEDNVRFLNLGLVVIDEQHRFGVAQRARLWEKNEHPPHILVMTATPIPRTLAMTLYGDLDVSVIDELPPGRKPIFTRHYSEAHRPAVYKFLKSEIGLGRQVYFVFPLIKESEKIDYQNLEVGFENLKEHFPEPHYRLGKVHGKLSSEEKEAGMAAFKSGEIDILVATTVIEVGVDVPNASVMVIESAERFGLSQLHQLRGRVGRGADQSYCILLTGLKMTAESKKRVSIMVETNDGFAISEADLQLRGPGDLDGTQQSGVAFDLKVASLAKDGDILQIAREKAMLILDEDPKLQRPENHLLANEINRRMLQKGNFAMIS